MNTQLFNVENTGGHAAPTGPASGRPHCILLLPLPSSLPCLDRGLTIVTLALGMPPRQWSHHPCPAPRYHSRLMPPCRRRHRLALVAVMPSLQLRLRYLARRHPPCCHPTVHSPQLARCPLSATASRPPHPSQLPTRCPLVAPLGLTRRNRPMAPSPLSTCGPLAAAALWPPRSSLPHRGHPHVAPCASGPGGAHMGMPLVVCHMAYQSVLIFLIKFVT